MNFDTFDDSYVARLRAGEAATEAHFVRYFSELLDLKLRSRVRSREIAEDLKQETFARVLKLMRSDQGIRNPERLGPLVNSVCNHVLSEQYRSAKRTEPLEEEEAIRLPFRGRSAYDGLVTEEAREAVRETLAKLSTRDRTILGQIFFEEVDKDEVCRRMGVSREYLRVLLHRAKNSFRETHLASSRVHAGSGTGRAR